MLGSVLDAEDAVQEALFRAWKGRERFDERSSLKTWLYRIATNVCLDVLASTARRRLRPVDLPPGPADVHEAMILTKRPREAWIEPIPDTLALPAEGTTNPEEYALLREGIRLAFVAALQYLPPRQRAVLLLTQVLDWSATEVAASLDMTVAGVNSALQRARRTLFLRQGVPAPRELSISQREVVEQYVSAFLAYDIGALVQLLHDDATLCMPPFDVWIKGRRSIGQWMLTLGAGCQDSVLVPVHAAGGAPAFAQYRHAGRTAWAILVLDCTGDRIGAITTFLDVEALFPRFGLPMRWAR
ncbi:MAG: RNA polymerase subunit sigma-70 [Gemmatimonadaceae bacterium]|nr:RNA polymerase subunit sigma-70 [Gemmatimonadaceae bacterium]